MAAQEMFLSFHGLKLPKETHDLDSLRFANEFTFKDNDVVAVTYPKSGQCFSKLKHVAVQYSELDFFVIVRRFFLLGKKFTLKSMLSCHFRFTFTLFNTCINYDLLVLVCVSVRWK